MGVSKRWRLIIICLLKRVREDLLGGGVEKKSNINEER